MAAVLLFLAGGDGLLHQEVQAQWWVKEFKFQAADGEQMAQKPAEEPAPAPPAEPEQQPAEPEPPVVSEQPPAPVPADPKPPVVQTAQPQPAQAEEPPPHRSEMYDRTNWDKRALDTLYWGGLTGIRISVLNGSGNPRQGGVVTALLNDYHRDSLERRIGQKIVVVNASTLQTSGPVRSVVYYRPGFMRAAMTVASVIPGRQAVLPMGREQKAKIGIDLEILLGRDSR